MSVVAGSVVVGGGGPGSLGAGAFPVGLFTIEDDPGALRASVQPYGVFARRALVAQETLAGTAVPSWVGSEGDLFRERRASFEPVVAAAFRSFMEFERLVSGFADEVERLVARMEVLRAQAQAVWAQLQAAQAAQAQADAAVATATAASAAVSAAAGADVVSVARAVAAVQGAQDAYGAASLRVSAWAAQWEECVRQAEALHAELLAAADEAAAGIRALEGPPGVPEPAAGGAGPGALGAVEGRALPRDPLAGGGSGDQGWMGPAWDRITGVECFRFCGRHFRLPIALDV